MAEEIASREPDRPPSKVAKGGAGVGSRALNALVGVFAALFLLGAVVQLNDPDPLRWMLLYLAAAIACLLAAIGRGGWQIPAAVGMVALIWAATLAPAVLGHVGMDELVAAWEMKNDRVEEGREMYGLLIVLIWMSVLAAIALRRRRHAR